MVRIGPVALVTLLAFGCGPRAETVATSATSAAHAPSAAAPGPSAASNDAAAPAKKAGPTPEVAVAGPGRLHVKGSDYEGVIVEGGTWTPSPGDVAEVESVLGPALADHELGRHQPARELKREYGGVTVDGNESVIIQLSCRAPGWPVEPLPSVKGGGACYGRASYDVAAHRVTELWANGPR